MKFSAIERGRRVAVSLQRSWMADMMALTQGVPTGGIARLLRVREAMKARRAVPGAPGWSAMIAKAYALVAARRPQLRYCLVRWPWTRFHEHPVSTCCVVTERDWRGEPMVLADVIPAPERMGLDELQYHFDSLRQWPVEAIGGYRRLLRFARLPRPLRRPLMRVGLNVWGAVHARYFGTFSINTIGLPRLHIDQSMTALTMSMFHGLPDADGQMQMSFFFDHRVLDGRVVGRVSSELEAALNGEIAAELRALVDRPRWRPEKS